MKKKIFARSLALGALMAFVITGSALAADESLYGIHVTANTADVDLVTKSQTDILKNSPQYGISVAGSKNTKPEVIAQVIAPNITFNVTNGSEKSRTIWGAYAWGYGGILLGDENSESINIIATNNYAFTSKGDSAQAIGIKTVSNSHGVSLFGQTINVTVEANNNAKAIDASYNDATVEETRRTLAIGSEATELVHLKAESNDYKAYGINIEKGKSNKPNNCAIVKVLGEKINVEAIGKSTTYGLNAELTSNIIVGSDATKLVHLTATSYNSSGYGINTKNDAVVDVNGENITVGSNAYGTATAVNAEAGEVNIGSAIGESIRLISESANSTAIGSQSKNASNVKLGNSNTQNLIITATTSGDYASSGVINFGKQTILGKHIEVNAINTNKTAVNTDEISNGIWNNKDSGVVVIGDNSTREIIVNAQTASSKLATGLNNKKGSVTLTANSMYLTATGGNACGIQSTGGINTLQTTGNDGKIAINVQGTEKAIGLYANDANSKIFIGGTNEGEALPDVTIKASVSGSTGEDGVLGIFAREHGQIEVNAKTLNIETHADGKNWAYGVSAQNNSKGDDIATVEINAENINVKSTADTKGHADGLVVMSHGIMNVTGNLLVNADDAIVARGDGTMQVNKDGKHSTKLNGDINFNYDKKTSGTKVDAGVLVNLTGVDSYWNGTAKVSWKDGAITPEDKAKVTGLKLIVADGAQWSPTVVDEYVTEDKNSGVERRAINNLAFNDGVINIKDGALPTIETINGSGGEANFEVNDDLTGGVLTIHSGGEETKVEAKYSVNADKVVTKANFAKLVGNTLHFDANAGVTGIAYVDEGLLTPAMSAVTTNDITGNTIELQNIQQGTSTTTMDNMRDVASTAIIAWRQEDSTLSQRLGELRNSEGDQGVWVRMSRGEFEYGGAFKNQYNYFQMGYDKAYGDWHYGAAISHNDGETTYANGSGDNRSTSLSLYGTWLGGKGQYADIVLKQGRLSNEFEIHAKAGDTRGDYDAWGTSLSGEYGMKLDMADGWYVTPQAQMTFMRIGGEDYTTSNGIRVSQDTLYSTVGRIGFELGKNITDKGSVYAKASLLHEFAGEADTYLRLGALHNSYSQDIGNTWYEAGIGFNYKTSANSYVYADVVKTFGDDFKTPWQWNAGMRWSF